MTSKGSMMSLEYCATNARGWDFFSLELPDLHTLPNRLDLTSPHFTCLMACNAETTENATLERLADRLLQQGLVFLCAWGPDCERVSHIFEHVAIQHDFRQGREYPAIISMNLRRDKLDTVTDYFGDACYPDSAFQRTCRSGLVLTVDTPPLTAYIRERLTAQTSDARFLYATCLR